MARSTGFEPAISSVTGRRDNPFTTSAYGSFDLGYDTKLVPLLQAPGNRFIYPVVTGILYQREYAALAQLVERHIRNV